MLRGILTVSIGVTSQGRTWLAKEGG